MIWSLQVLRFIAAMLVVFVHATEAALHATGSASSVPRGIALLGHSGVDIFFVLSGVVIARSAPGLAPAQFAWK
jgi:exopolysaccharide production protein ExoZ